MKVHVNGSLKEIEKGSLKSLLEDYHLDVEFTVVELNGEIIPKEKVLDTSLQEGDRLELIRFMGGG